MGMLDIFTATATAANDSAIGQIEERTKKAVEAVAEHKRMDKRFPCGHIHFDMVEAILALYAKGDVSFQAVKAFSRIVMVSSLVGSLSGGSIIYGAFYLIERRAERAEVKRAAVQLQETLRPEVAAMVQPEDPS